MAVLRNPLAILVLRFAGLACGLMAATTTVVFSQGESSTPIPQAAWTLKFVDSQDTIGGNYAATNAFDGSAATFWHTQWATAQPPPPHEIQIDLGGMYPVSGFRYLPRQDGLPNGRIAQFEFYVSLDGETWGAPVATGTLADVATQQEVLFAAKVGQYIRLRALSEVSGRPYTSMAELDVLSSGNRPPDSVISAPAGDVTIEPGGTVTFNGTGTDPDNDVPLTYLWNFGTSTTSTSANPGAITFPNAGMFTVTFTVTDAAGLSDPVPATRTIVVQNESSSPVIPQTNWTLRFVDSQDTSGGNYAATNAFDGSAATFWHTQWAGAQPPPPHEIQINLGGMYPVSGFRYLPRQDGLSNGRIAQYEFYVSLDGTTWGTPVATGTLANVATQQQVLFTAKVGQYIRLRALSEVSGLPYTAVAELNVLSSGNRPPDSAIGEPTGDVTIAPGQTVTFSGSGTDPDNNLPLTYLWNFGTGTTSTSASPGAVTFPTAGTFTVTFTVTDAASLADPVPATRTVVVQTGSSSPVIPQTNWTLRFVDSQDTSGGNYAATNAFDGSAATFWHTQWAGAQPPPPHEIQINLGGMYPVSGFRYLPRQDGLSNGRIAQYEFYVSLDGTTWGTPVATGTLANVATQQEVLFAAKVGQYIRLRALSEVSGRPYTSMAELNLLSSGNRPPDSVITAPSGDVTIAPGQTVTFSGSGTDPENNLPLTYLWDFGTSTTSTSANPGAVTFPTAGTFTVTFTVTDAASLADPVPATRTVVVQNEPSSPVIPQTNWTLRFVDSQYLTGGNYAGTNAFDGNASTFWHTEFGGNFPHPHEIQIDLGHTYSVNGFRYLPRQNGQSGRVGQYEFYVSGNGTNWGAPVAVGAFPDTNSGAEREVRFLPKSGRYIRLRILSEVNGEYWAAVAELNVLQASASANQAPLANMISPSQNLTILAGTAVELAGSATDPDGNLPLTYRWGVTPGSGIVDSEVATPGHVQFDRPGNYTVTFTVTDALGQTAVATRSVSVVAGLSVPRGAWTVRFVDSQAAGFAAALAFDNDPATFWHTEWQIAQPPPPHQIQIDLGAAYAVTGFRYLPRQDGIPNGNIGQYQFYVSSDGSDWGTPVAVGSFTSSSSVKDIATVLKTGRYVRLQALTEANGLPYTSVAELEVFQKACITPSVRLVRPPSRHLQTSTDLSLEADACLTAGEGVRFVVDGDAGGIQLDDYSAPYSATASGLSFSEHLIEAHIIDAGGTPLGDVGAYDRAADVAIGDSYVAIGDGMTYGYADDRPEDDNSQDGRTMLGGYTPILADALTVAKGYPVTVANAAVGGTASGDGAAAIQSVLGAYPDAQRVLVMYGHNDAIRSVSSGLGLRPQDVGYTGSFKHNMQRIIDAVRAAGKAPILAKAPGVLPLNSGIDLKVQEYNQVIEELAADPANGIPVQPPDFHAHFETRADTEYADSILMNGLGYQSMAQVWLQVLGP